MSKKNPTTAKTERDFQKWMVREMLPSVFSESSVAQVESKGRLGVSDIIAMVPEVGCMAIELKYRPSAPVRDGTGLLRHELSGPQRRFLLDWSNANSGSMAFIAIGVGWGKGSELHLFEASFLKYFSINELTYGDRRESSKLSLDDVVGKNRKELLQYRDALGNVLSEGALNW